MKKISILFYSFILFTSASFAQKVGYVNTKEVMSQMEEYTTAQSEINGVSQKWQQDLEKFYQVIEDKYKDYQANEVIMPEDLRKQRQEEIFKLEREAKEYKEKKFGYNGELFQLQDTKVKPIQDRVLKAVETIAVKKRVDFVFDKASGDVTWLYTNSTFDLTPELQKELGLEVTEVQDAKPTGSGK
jgi:outer membrane protein